MSVTSNKTTRIHNMCVSVCIFRGRPSILCCSVISIFMIPIDFQCINRDFIFIYHTLHKMLGSIRFPGIDSFLFLSSFGFCLNFTWRRFKLKKMWSFGAECGLNSTPRKRNNNAIRFNSVTKRQRKQTNKRNKIVNGKKGFAIGKECGWQN